MNRFKLLLIACVSMIMVACNPSQGNTPNPEDGGSEKETYEVKYSVPNLYELLKFATITIYYSDENGMEQSEVLEKSPWSKTIEGVEAPYTAKIRMQAARNDEELTQSQYKVTDGYGIFYRSSGDSVWGGSTESGEMTIPAENVDAYIEAINKLKGKSHTID